MSLPSQESKPPALRLRTILTFIAVVQLVLGLAFLLFPSLTARLLTLPPAPGWTDWLFGMMAARFLGYGVGMLSAARQPYEHRAWIQSMIAIQLIDWIVTLLHLGNGDVTLRQVTTAAFLPVLFVAVLVADRRHWLQPANS